MNTEIIKSGLAGDHRPMVFYCDLMKKQSAASTWRNSLFITIDYGFIPGDGLLWGAGRWHGQPLPRAMAGLTGSCGDVGMKRLFRVPAAWPSHTDTCAHTVGFHQMKQWYFLHEILYFR